MATTQSRQRNHNQRTDRNDTNNFDNNNPKIIIPNWKNLLAHADSLLHYDKRKSDEDTLKLVTNRFDDLDNLSITELYEVGAELGISREYIEKARRLQYPTLEEQIADIEQVGAVPNKNFVKKMYQDTIYNTMSYIFPEDNFQWIETSDSYKFNRKRDTGKITMFGRKKIENKKLAEIGKYYNHIRLTVFSPTIFSTTKDEIEKLRLRFDEQIPIKIIYDY